MNLPENPITGASVVNAGAELADFDTCVAAVEDAESPYVDIAYLDGKSWQRFTADWATNPVAPPREETPPAPPVGPLECGPVHDASATLVICVGDDAKADELARGGITALVFERLRGSRSFSSGFFNEREPDFDAPMYHSDDYVIDRRLFRYGLDGRRVIVLAQKHDAWRSSDPAPIVAELLRVEGARVTVVPEADDVIAALKAAYGTYGALTRTTGGGDKPAALIDGILYQRQKHLIFGATGRGKTMLALWTCVQRIKAGENVVYHDRENGPGRIFDRLRELGCTDDERERHFHYFYNEAATFDAAPDYRALIAEVGPSLVVYDSFIMFLSAAGVSEESSTGVASWFAEFASDELDCATLILDHTPKAADDTARGSGRKGDDPSVMWQLRGEFSPDRLGNITLALKKSRDGGLPDRVVFTAGGTPLRFERGGSRKLAAHERTLETLEDGMTSGEWQAAAGLKRDVFQKHRGKLADEGRVNIIDGAYYRVDE
jgi:hypothetical protein